MAQYILKDALIAEIENRIKNLNERLIKHPISSPTLEKLIEENKKILSFLDTIKVKEVDLEKEIRKYIKDNICGYCVPGTEETAKYFFELGLKAQKGE